MKIELLIIGVFLIYSCTVSVLRKTPKRSGNSIFFKIADNRITNVVGIIIGVYSLLEGLNFG